VEPRPPLNTYSAKLWAAMSRYTPAKEGEMLREGSIKGPRSTDSAGISASSLPYPSSNIVRCFEKLALFAQSSISSWSRVLLTISRVFPLPLLGPFVSIS